MEPVEIQQKGFKKKITMFVFLLFFLSVSLGFVGGYVGNNYDKFDFLKEDSSIDSVVLGASAPGILSFQGRITDLSETPITSSSSMTFRLYSVPTSGTALWTGSCSVTPDQDGIFDIILGSTCGSAIPTSVFAENDAVYLGITVGTDTEMSPRQRIAASAYALNADTLKGFSPSQTPGIDEVVVLDASGNLVFGVTDPVISATGNIKISPGSGSNVGIGTGASSPAALLSVGDGSKFRVDTGGDITRIKDLVYSWPTAHPTTGQDGFLQSDDAGNLTWTELPDGSYVWGLDAVSFTEAQFLETSGIATLSNYGVDSGTEYRAWIHGASQKTGFSVYSNYSGASGWPVVSFKADSSTFTGAILKLVQDGTGNIFEGYKGSDLVYKIDNKGDMHLSSNGVAYFEPFASAPSSGDLAPNSEGCIYSVGVYPTLDVYWDPACTGSAAMKLNTTSTSLWTDGGTFTYLSSTTDDLVLGATTPGSSKFFFDMSTGRLGIGTDTPQTSIDIAGASSEISNTDGDITIVPNGNLIVSGGNLGINTTSAIKTLTVAGNMSMYFTNTGTGSTNIFDTTYTQSVAAPSGTIYGYYNKANYTDTGTMLEMGAAKYDAQNDSTGTVTRLYTLDANVFNKTTGTVTTAAAIHARGFQEAYAGTISSLHTMLVENAHKGSGGTITGQSGLTVAGLTSGTNNTHLLLGTTTIPSGNYSIYSGSTNESYFSGILTVGGTGSSSGLRLAGGGTKIYTDASNGAIRLVPGNGWLSIRDGTDTYDNLLVSSTYTRVREKLAVGFAATPTVSVAVGDSDTGLNWISDGNLAVYTNGSERMRIASDGNVGIGTSPGMRLHVRAATAAGWSAKLETDYGNIEFGPVNTGGAHIYTDRPLFYFNKKLVILSNDISSYNGDFLLQRQQTTKLTLGDTVSSFSGKLLVNGSSVYNSDSAISGFGPVCSYFGASAYVNSVCLSTPAAYPGIVFYSLEGYRADIQKIGGDLRFRTYDQTGSNPTLVFYASANSNVYGNAGFIANAFDLAEYAKTSELNLSTGDVVSFVPNSKEKIEGTKGLEYVPAGVISTKPGLVMGNGPIDNIAEEDKRENDPSWKLLALIGRVPVKISLSPGEVINVNDYLDVSSIPRYAKKQTSAGLALGKAMETFNPSLLSCTPVSSASNINWPTDEGHNESKPCYVLPDGTYVGKVMMFVNVSWYDPRISVPEYQEDKEDLLRRIEELEKIYNAQEENYNIASILKLNQTESGDIEILGGKIIFEGNGTLSIRKLKVEDGYGAGSGLILGASTSVLVESKAVTKDSKIFVNPTSDTLDKQLYVTDIVEGESFKVNIREAIEGNITFDWFIVDSKKNPTLQ